MNSVLILNLGSNDLQLKDDKCEDMKKIFSNDNKMLEMLEKNHGIADNFKLFTRKILNNYPKGIEYIDFPIIKSCMEKIKNDLKNDKLTEIIFVTTDQDHKKDTIKLGEILIKIVNDKKDKKLKENIGFSGFNGTPKLKTWCINENPSDYDLMMKKYEYNLNNKLKGAEKLFIEITGGTPAMSTALLVNATNQVNIKVIPFYIDRKSKDAYSLTISESLRKYDSKKQICIFIKNQNYKGAETLVRDFVSKYDVSEKKQVNIIFNMIQSASSRVEFDFDSAEKYIKTVKDDSPVSRYVCSNFQKYLQQLKDKNKIYLLNELKNNALYKYNNGAYTDFLGRIFRIQEDIYSNILIRKNVVTCNKEDTKLFLRGEAFSDNQRDILNSIEIEPGVKLQYKNCELNIESMKKILDVIVEKNCLEFELLNECSKLKGLKSLRNKTILAHGYKAVSKDKIDDEIGDTIEFLNNLILKYKKVFDTDINDDNFYEKNGEFNNHLVKLVEEI
ncbi:hypothetical protein [Clostridium felsineum]|uniref:hypothetical protein n=1 Tax=Clostridium felsineum TaxID=36839 RepID=UPI00098C7467|nr:hypothetical protein [Clostridium felsineum]URZ02303.1 hypothetical protein CLAUR_023000 [Clostridium felsineum]